jgi:[ribosomal protein S5]-alanine N-acetyltransferase
MPTVISLEPIAPAHAAALQRLLEDPAIAETTPFPSPYPPHGAERYVEDALTLRAAGTKYTFTVLDPDGTPVGMSMLKDVAGVEGELGYWIGKPYWGGGRATAAAHATLAYGFETLGLSTIRAVCLEMNVASLRVLAKLGFVQTGRVIETLAKWPDPRPATTWTLSRVGWLSK